MTGPWAVRYTHEGTRRTIAGMDQALAGALAAEYQATLPGSDPETVNLAAELAQVFPEGARVRWNGHWETTGVVTPECTSPLSNYPPGIPVAVAVDHRGDGMVCVRLDGHPYPIWVRARYIHVYQKAPA